MYISRIHLRNIRGIKDLDLPIIDEKGKTRLQTLFIGKNGTAKTTILRCIAIGLADTEEANTLIAETSTGAFVSNGAREGEIILELTDHVGRTTTNSKVIMPREDGEVIRTQGEEIDRSVNDFLIGFGVGRSMEGSDSGSRYRIAETAHSLFNYEGTFIQAELTLRRLNDFLGAEKYDLVMNRILQALGLSPKDRIQFLPGGGVEVEGPSVGGRISLQSWADGYRITLNWILDIYAWAMRHPSALTGERARPSISNPSASLKSTCSDFLEPIIRVRSNCLTMRTKAESIRCWPLVFHADTRACARTRRSCCSFETSLPARSLDMVNRLSKPIAPEMLRGMAR